MKRIWTYFLALLALVLAGTGIADAQTGYGLYVGQTQVTSANAGDVLGNGQFAYDVSTKTLTVTNATLDNQACRALDTVHGTILLRRETELGTADNEVDEVAPQGDAARVGRRSVE